MPMTVSEIYDAKVLRERSGLSLPYIRLLTQKKKIPHIRIGRRVLYRADSIETWLQSKLVEVDRKATGNGNDEQPGQ